MTRRSRLAVLISGGGSNLQAIIDAIENGGLPGTRVVLVVSDRPDAFGLERARRHGIPALYFQYPSPGEGRQARRDRDRELAALLGRHRVDWVVLAGWLRILSSEFLRDYPMRVVNLHPALPGMFPGLDAIERAFEAYRAGQILETGVMVHLVPDERVDEGPVLSSQPVPIHADDDLESLTDRMHRVEHELLVEALSHLISEN